MNDDMNDKVGGINHAQVLSEQRLTADQLETETALYIVEKSAEMIIMANRVGLTRLSQRLSEAHDAATRVVERATDQGAKPSTDAS